MTWENFIWLFFIAGMAIILGTFFILIPCFLSPPQEQQLAEEMLEQISYSPCPWEGWWL